MYFSINELHKGLVYSQQIRWLHWWCVVVQIQPMRSHWWTYWNSCYQLGLTLPYMTGEQTLITACERSLGMIFNQSKIFPANHGLVYWQYKYTKMLQWKFYCEKPFLIQNMKVFPHWFFPVYGTHISSFASRLYI